MSALQPATRPRAFRFKEKERTLAVVAFGDGAPGSPAAPLIMDESDTERVLEERLEGYGGRVERGVELLSFETAADGVTATLSGPDGPSLLRARFLAGCDGANSTVRREAAIGFSGGSYPERFLLADLDLDWEVPHDEGTIWFGDQAGVAAAVPLPGVRRWRVIVALEAAAAAGLDTAPAAVAARVEAALRERAAISLRRVGEPLWASAFHIHRKLADRYRVGPVFIAGDAAHVHSPVGGQGMNTGIQDAFNLGWKLALAVRGQDAPGLLDSYERERRPVAAGVLRGTDLSTRLVLGAHPVGRALREYLLPVVADLAPVRERLLATASELGVGYRYSPLSVDADVAGATRRPRWRGETGLRAGDRVPEAALTDPESDEPQTLFELIARGWTLLLFPGRGATGARLAQLGDVARQVRGTVGDAVHPILVRDAVRDDRDDIPELLDPAGDVTRIFGADAALVALVRPDGYLGYRGRPDQAGELASYLARVFAMRVVPADVS
jgi:2-polyprenyl-6-methoxyphenol hydroxylase-like FAD-dependent oxidoreductase